MIGTGFGVEKNIQQSRNPNVYNNNYYKFRYKTYTSLQSTDEVIIERKRFYIVFSTTLPSVLSHSFPQNFEL